MSDLNLSLLGPVRATLAGQPIKFRTRKAQALLIYLATEAWQQPDVAPRRETLLALLWPDYPGESARHSLRTDLYYLRKVIPSAEAEEGGDSTPLVLSDNRSVQMNPAVSYGLDLADFSQHLDFSANHDHPELLTCADCEERLGKAVDLYRGNFLADFYLPDSATFEVWVAALREGFRGQALGALETLTAVYGEQEAFEAAEAMARRQLELDNLRESAHRQLMAILARSGRRRAALSQYESCRQLLQDELGVEPSAETEALYEAIRGGELGSGKKPETVDLLPAAIGDLPPFLEELETTAVESSPVVAREGQLVQLGQHLEKTLDGHGQIVFITGEAGQGKTTLLNEFGRRALAADPGLIVAGGNCDAYAGVGDPYHPFREVLGLLGGDVESRLAAGVMGRDQAERLWRLMPDTALALAEDGPDLVDLFVSGKALVGRLATGVAVQPAWLGQLNDLVGTNAPRSANMEQSYLFEQFARVLKGLATDRPLVITLDDLQWADTGSISLLFHLGRRLEGSRILIVGAYRPEEVALKRTSTGPPGSAEQHPLAGVVSELKRQHGDIWLDLGDPVTVEGRQFVDTYLDTRPNLLDEAFRETLFRRTQGHALFTVELLRAMYERGDLRQDKEGRWLESEAIDWTTLPVKVEGAIERRIERLEEEIQAILTTASVEGETFTAEVVAQVQQIDQRALVQQLSRELDKRHRLVKAQALEWLEPGRKRISLYRFQHHLFQHYLYNRLDEVERGYLHEAVGVVLEQLYEGRTEQVAGQLARHFELAGLASKAVNYLQVAGQAATDAYAHTEAVAYYTRAVELAELAEIDLEELAHLYLRLGGLLLVTKGDGTPEVDATYSRAYELYQQVGESPQLFTALRGLAMYHKLRGESETARKLTEQMMDLANSLQEPVLIVEACFALGSLFFYTGEFVLAQEYLEQGISNYDIQQHQSLALLDDQDPGVANLSYAALNLWMLGYPDRALERCSEALALAQELSHPYSRAMTLIWYGWVHRFRREGREVQEQTEAAISLSEKHDFTLFVTVGTLLRGWALAEQEEVEEAILQTQQVLADTALTHGLELAPPFLLALVAETYGYVGQPEEGLRIIVKAQALLNEEREWLWVEAEIPRLMGELLLLCGQSEAEVEANFQQAIEIARRQGARSLELRAATSLARLWSSQGKRDEARQLLAPVYGWFSEGFDTLDLIEAKALLEELSVSEGATQPASMTLDNTLLASALVGRAGELASLEAAIQSAGQGKGQSVLIAGEAGIGKSRLMAEIRSRAAADGFGLLAGQCFEPDLTFPYAPLIDALRSFLASHPADNKTDLLGPLAPELVKLLPELALTMPGLQPTPSLDPESEKRRLFEALAQFVSGLAGSPLLFILEDIHWADETSLEFLHYFARRLPAFPILMLLTYRHEEVSAPLSQFLAQMNRGRMAQEMRLTSLRRQQVDLMLQGIFGLNRPVRAGFLNTIFKLTEGNPFFIEEVLKSMAAAGDIFFQSGRWDRKPLDELHIPPTVLAAVQERSAGLDERAQEILTLAAVAGQRFDLRLLKALTGHGEGELLAVVKGLVATQLVVEESAYVFAFRHALTRQAIYSGLLAGERRQLHRTIAETLEGLYPEARIPSVNLAYHYYQAEAWEEAIDQAQRAGKEALTKHANYAALEQFNRAIDAGERLGVSKRPELYHARGQVQERLGDFEAALGDYTAALNMASKDGDDEEIWRNLLALGFLWSGRDYEQSGTYLQDALTRARQLENPALLAHSLNRIGNWQANMEQTEVAHDYHEEARLIFQELGDPSGLATTLDLLGTTAYLAGDMPAGIVYYEQAIPYFRQTDDQPGLISCLGSYTARGANNFTMVAPPIPLAESEGDAGEGIRLAQKIGWRAGEAFVRIMWGFRLAAAGEYTRALYQASTAWQLATDVESISWQAFSQSALGVIYADILDLPAACDHLEKALQLARTVGAPELHRTVVGFLAPVYVSAGHVDKAESLLGTFRERAIRGKGGSRTAPTFTSESQRFAWFANADLALANEQFQDVLDLVEYGLKSMPHVAEGGIVPRLWQLRGEGFLGLNRVSEAIDLFQAAQATAEAQGAHPFLWRNLVSLGKAHLAARRREEAAAAFDQARQIVETLAADLNEPALRAHFQSQAAAVIPKLPPRTPLQKEKARYGGLTRREREVAALVAAGMSNLEIGERLFIGERTVETHVSHILTKLEFDNRTQIAAWAVEVDLESAS